MKAYLMTTATLFAVIALLHLWEVFAHGHLEVEDPFVIALAVGLSVWGWRLARTRPPAA